MATKVTTVKVRDTNFDVLVDGGGLFLANFNGAQLQAPTLEGLKDKLAAATRATQVKVNVEFEKLEDNGETYPGVCYGIHANGNLLVRYEGSKKSEQERSYWIRSTVRRLTPEERGEWSSICRQLHELSERKAKFEMRNRLDVEKLVKAEMAKLTGVKADE